MDFLNECVQYRPKILHFCLILRKKLLQIKGSCAIIYKLSKEADYTHCVTERLCPVKRVTAEDERGGGKNKGGH